MYVADSSLALEMRKRQQIAMACDTMLWTMCNQDGNDARSLAEMNRQSAIVAYLDKRIEEYAKESEVKPTTSNIPDEAANAPVKRSKQA